MLAIKVAKLYSPTMMKRTPKYYDGIQPVAKTIRELLPEVVGSIRKRENLPDLLEAWPRVIGETMASRTRAVSFVDGVLTVIVQSSALFSLLRGHERPLLLKKLQQQFPKHEVRDLQFRIGQV
jgi:hypothetical protein